MADQLDRAHDFEEMNRKICLGNKRPEGPKATGFCLYCEEPIEGRWCDEDCREDWEQERKRR